VWTAPYFHDGSRATLDDVLDHYRAGGVSRPSRSPDMPRVLTLEAGERDQLLSFLETLSSDRPPRPLAQISAIMEAAPPPQDVAVAATTVSQKDKLFAPRAITISVDQPLTVINDDTRPHNVRIHDPRMTFDSGVQEPGDKAVLEFRTPGLFDAFCGIHPNMRLMIEVR
jgi:cytochrome c peroxidase